MICGEGVRERERKKNNARRTHEERPNDSVSPICIVCWNVCVHVSVFARGQLILTIQDDSLSR